MAAVDTFLYCQMENGVQIYSINDPANPYVLKSYHLKEAQLNSRICVSDGFLYVARYDRIHIFAIANGIELTRVSEISLSQVIGKIEIDGNRLYIGTMNLYGDSEALPSFYIYDISSPSDPTVLGKYVSSFEDKDFRSFAILGNTVYGVNYWSEKIEIVSIANISQPSLVGQIVANRYPEDVVIQDSMLYIAAGFGKLTVIDVTNTLHPVLKYQWNVGTCKRLYLHDSVLYVQGFSDIAAIDITPTGTYDTLCLYDPGTTHHILSFYGSLLLNPMGYGFTIADVSDPTAIYGLVDYSYDQFQVAGVAINNGYAYCTDNLFFTGLNNRAGLFTIDVSDQALPNLTDWIGEGSPHSVTAFDTLTLVTDDDNTYIYSLAEPSHPVFLDFYDASIHEDRPYSFTIRNSYAFVSGLMGVDIVDISDIRSPVRLSGISSAQLGFYPLHVLCHYNYCYVSGYHGDDIYVAAINLGNYTNPQFLSRVKISGAGLDNRWGTMAVRGNYLYVSGAINGLTIIDIGNPLAIDIASTYTPAVESCKDLAVVRKYLIFSDEYCYEVLDIYDPINPRLVQFVESPVQPFEFDKDDDYIYGANDQAFDIYRLNLPAVTCGDANADQTVNVGDAIFIVNFVFTGGLEPDPWAAADVNQDGAINIGDAISIINYIFKGGPAPCSY